MIRSQINLWKLPVCFHHPLKSEVTSIIKMKSKPILLLTLAILAAFLLSACGGNVGTATSWAGLSADEENAYIAYNQHVYSVNLDNGQESWRFPAEKSAQRSYYAAPTLTADGQLIVGDYGKTLHSLNPDTGAENWSSSEATDRYIGSALTTDNLIYAPNASHKLFSFDLQGNYKWDFISQGPLWAKPVTEEACECVYIPSMDHHVYAIDAQTGEQKWQSENLGGSVVGTPALSPEGVLYAGSFGSKLVAIDSKDGRILWETPSNDWVWGGPILQDKIIYFGDLSGTLYAVDANTGSIRWQKTPDGPITESPLVTEDSIYITTETGGFIALDLNGNVRWTKPFETKLHTAPVKAGDKILVAATGNPDLLYAFDSAGNQLWAFTPETQK